WSAAVQEQRWYSELSYKIFLRGPSRGCRFATTRRAERLVAGVRGERSCRAHVGPANCGRRPLMSPISTAVSIEPLGHPVDATVELPGSKSYTNRALLIAALAEARSVIRRALFSDDTRAMHGALSALGINVEADPDAE